MLATIYTCITNSDCVYQLGFNYCCIDNSCVECVESMNIIVNATLSFIN